MTTSARGVSEKINQFKVKVELLIRIFFHIVSIEKMQIRVFFLMVCARY